MMETKAIACRLKKEHHDKLVEQAEKRNMLLGEYVRCILAAWAEGELDEYFEAIEDPDGYQGSYLARALGLFES